VFEGRAGKAGKGWDSSDFGRMEIKLGPDRALIAGKRGARNKAALKELGYLDNNGNWYKETPADRAFVKDQERGLKEGRLKVVDENKEWLAPGKKVKRVGTKLLGVIDKIDKDGFVVIGDERYNPIHLYPVREPKLSGVQAIVDKVRTSFNGTALKSFNALVEKGGSRLYRTLLVGLYLLFQPMH
jgi:hypothetical protein